MLKTASVFGAALFATLSLTAASAKADDEGAWVDRKQTLPPLVIAVDGGLGVGHYNFGGNGASISGTGFGLNAEGSIGIIPHFTAGARVLGINFGDDAKIANAAGYASSYDLQNVFLPFSGADTFSNPELWARYEFVDMPNVEVSGEGRVYLPFDSNTRFVIEGGVPVAIHLPNTLRVDTGGYVAVGGYSGTLFYLHIPVQAWFNVTDKVFLGPITGLSFATLTDRSTDSQTALNLGFGVGYTVLPELDIKVLPIYWQGINLDNGVSNFGFSAGVEYRIDKLANR